MASKKTCRCERRLGRSGNWAINLNEIFSVVSSSIGTFLCALWLLDTTTGAFSFAWRYWAPLFRPQSLICVWGYFLSLLLILLVHLLSLQLMCALCTYEMQDVLVDDMFILLFTTLSSSLVFALAHLLFALTYLYMQYIVLSNTKEKWTAEEIFIH